MDITLGNLAIEVTRRCNMNCAHCLRGNAQNMDIDYSYIDKLLENVSTINYITFTGGEPSLNVAAIDYTLKKCQEKNISVGGFYIVTNAKQNTIELAIAALKWYAFVDSFDREYTCGITVSQDMFHDYIDDSNIDVLEGLAFFSKDDKKTDFNSATLINEGRAKELSSVAFSKRELPEKYLEIDMGNGVITIESMIYLSANGDIRTDCDTAYDNDDYTIGNLNSSSLIDIIDTYQKNENEEINLVH